MSLRKTYEDQQKQKEQLQKQIEQVQKSTEQAEKQNAQKQQSMVEKLTENLEEKNREISKLKRENSDLTRQESELMREISGLKQKNLKLTRANSNLTRYNQEYSQRLKESEKLDGERQKRGQSQQSLVEELTEKLEGANQEISGLKRQSEEDQNQIADLEEKNGELQDKCRDSSSDSWTIECLKRDLKESEDREGRDKERIADLERSNKKKEEKIKEFQDTPIVAAIWVAFGSLALCLASHSEAFAGDFKAAYQAIGGFLWGAVKAFIDLGEMASQVSEGIPQAIVALIVHWAIRVTIPAVLIGAVAALIIILIYEAYKYFVYGLKFADDISLAEFLATICLVAGFAKPIQGILPVNLNLIVLVMIIQALYIFFRMIVTGQAFRYGHW